MKVYQTNEIKNIALLKVLALGKPLSWKRCFSRVVLKTSRICCRKKHS